MPPFPASPQMALALAEARAAALRGEVPIGAVVSGPDGSILAAAGNRTLELRDPTAHAELLAIRAACAALGSERLPGCTLHVTLEPCPMCASAISQARIATLVYGASDPKSGGIEQGPRMFTHPQSHHVPEVIAGISASESAELLKDFFKGLRQGFPSK
jgi:cytidine deaminase